MLSGDLRGEISQMTNFDLARKKTRETPAQWQKNIARVRGYIQS